MRNSDATGGVLAVIMFIGVIASWVLSGIVAWNWVEPDSFGGALVFILVWGIIGKVFDFGISLVIAGIASILD